MKKFNTNTPLPDLKNALDRWVTFLTKAHEFSKNKVPSELKNEPGIEKAITVLDTLYLDDTERQLYEGHLKWLRDEDAAIELAEYRGKIKGKIEGEEIGLIKGKIEGKLEIAKALKNSGMSVENIQTFTGLSFDEINQIV